MGKQMTFWLFIGMFQGIVDQTKAFHEIEDAKRAFYEFTKINWDDVSSTIKAWKELQSSDFDGSVIKELQIEA